MAKPTPEQKAAKEREEKINALLSKALQNMAAPLNRNLGSPLTQDLGRGIYGAMTDEMNALAQELKHVLAE